MEDQLKDQLWSGYYTAYPLEVAAFVERKAYLV
jgi:hypothetical protein